MAKSRPSQAGTPNQIWPIVRWGTASRSRSRKVNRDGERVVAPVYKLQLYRLVHLASSTPSSALSSASQSLHHAPLSLNGSGARLTASE